MRTSNQSPGLLQAHYQACRYREIRYLALCAPPHQMRLNGFLLFSDFTPFSQIKHQQTSPSPTCADNVCEPFCVQVSSGYYRYVLYSHSQPAEAANSSCRTPALQVYRAIRRILRFHLAHLSRHRHRLASSLPSQLPPRHTQTRHPPTLPSPPTARLPATAPPVHDNMVRRHLQPRHPTRPTRLRLPP